MPWKLVQWKECDGVGCCDKFGLFTEDGFSGRCAMWTGSRCSLMLAPQTTLFLRPAELRAFATQCIAWPMPSKVESLDRTYTDGEKEATRLDPPDGCCYKWEQIDA